MKKNSSMQGTLNKLFGKKTASNNSLYANNPPWILPQGARKASIEPNDEVHNSFSFLDDSGTATLKSRPGPRARPILQFSTSTTEAQGLAVPTPSVPAGFTENTSIGNGPKLNGNYRMYSSVGDLRLHNYYDHDDDHEEIPAPPSMPPPPPPTMAPPPPPPQQQQLSPPSSAISSPSSPSPPDFIPPTPNSSVPMPPSYLPTDQSEQHQTNNVTKWKSETVLHAGTKDLPMTLPNRYSLNPAAFQHNQGQTNFSVEPQSTLPRSFKVPPPAPARTSSIQLQEPQNINSSKDPPQCPVPSSFNPSFQAKLYTLSPGQQPVNDTLNKRKSMLIMEDLPDFSENSDQRMEKPANVTNSVNSRVPLQKDNTNVLQNSQVELNKGNKNGDAINDNKIEPAPMFKEDHIKQPYKLNNNLSEFTSVHEQGGEGQKYSHNDTERNTLSLNKRNTLTLNKTSKPTVQCISIKPIISDLSLSNGSKHNSLTRKEMDIFPQGLTRIDNEVNLKRGKSLENVNECPPTPPLKAPPPSMTLPPNQQLLNPLPRPVQNITPPKTPPTIKSTAPPPAPPLVAAPVVRMPSPMLSPKPKTISVTPNPPALVPPPPPPKAPPAPPPLPSSDGPLNSVPLLEALQAKQQTLRKVPKSIEVRPAQTNSPPSVDDEQKARVGKIKGELEALFSPKKDEKGERLKNSRMEANRNSNGNVSQPKGGENKLVNSLMLKVPLLPAKFEREDADTDSSEWVPKSNKMDIQIPEPDYLPASPIPKPEKPTYSEVQSKIPKATLDVSVPPLPVASPEKDTNTAGVLDDSIPTYKPHRETKVSTRSISIVKLPVEVSKPGINLDNVPQNTELEFLEPSVRQESPPTSPSESTITHPVTGEQVVANSPMALLMAAQKRAQKAKSLERGNLPKISVTSGVIKSASPYNERRANTFVVVPNKESIQNSTEEEVTSFTYNSSQHSDNIPYSSTRRDAEPQSSEISSTLGRNTDNSNDRFSVPYLYNSAEIPFSTTNRHEEYLKLKSTTFDNHISTTVPSSTESPSFNISSFPSPIPGRRMDNETEYGIIPPPEEFMNSPVPSMNSGLQQENRSYDFDRRTSLQSDLIPNYDRSNSVTQPYASLSTTSNLGYNSYSNDNYGTTQSRSLIKRRLYMPEPESSWNHGKSTSSLRSSTLPGAYMHGQTSSNMVLDPRRSNTTSRFVPQGRMVPPMTDQKYRSPTTDYPVGKPSSSASLPRAQSKQPGMTFTVRPGTRQPISQMYQGGYL